MLASASPNRPALPRRGGGFVLLDGASPRVWSRAEGRKALGSARGGGADDAPQPPVVRRALCITVTRLYIRRAGVAGSSCEFWGGGADRLAFFLLTSARAMGWPPPVRIRWRVIGWRRCWGTGWQSPVCRSSTRSVAALEGWVQCEAVVCVPVDDRVPGARVGRAQGGPRQRELGRGLGLGRDWGDVHELRAAELWAWGCDAWGRAGQGHGQPLAWA